MDQVSDTLQSVLPMQDKAVWYKSEMLRAMILGCENTTYEDPEKQRKGHQLQFFDTYSDAGFHNRYVLSDTILLNRVPESHQIHIYALRTIPYSVII